MNRNFLFPLVFSFTAILLGSCKPEGRKGGFDEAAEKKEVWKAVETRFYSWKENDFEAHMSVYHPDWRRWTPDSRILMKKEDFTGLWNTMKDREQVIEMKLEPGEIVFYGNGDIAVAHFISTESYLWIGPEETNARGEAVERGSAHTVSMRWSDVMVKEDGKWLYVGGHRDGGTLPEGD